MHLDGAAAWVRLQERLTAAPPEKGRALLEALGHVRDDLGVELLLARLDDETVLDHRGRTAIQVGDVATDSLRWLTGQVLGRKRGAWTAWWDAVGRTLPPESDAEEER